MRIQVFKNHIIDDYSSWPIWSCEISEFDWKYDDEEHCFIIDGSVTVKTADEIVEINAGDYVVFPKNLQCTWKVHEPIKKHYSFK